MEVNWTTERDCVYFRKVCVSWETVRGLSVLLVKTGYILEGLSLEGALQPPHSQLPCQRSLLGCK